MTALSGLLLGIDEVALYAPGDLDAHGWREPGDGPAAWTGTGNLQLTPGVSDPRAESGGGHGPHGPARDLTGTLFLPTGAEPAEGMIAEIRDRLFVLSQVRYVADPITPGGGIACWAATATTVDTWPKGGEPRAGLPCRGVHRHLAGRAAARGAAQYRRDRAARRGRRRRPVTA